jgi:hypothetical protein
MDTSKILVITGIVLIGGAVLYGLYLSNTIASDLLLFLLVLIMVLYGGYLLLNPALLTSLIKVFK